MNKQLETIYKTGSAVDAANPTDLVPVLRGLPGLGVAFQLHRNALGFFAETIKQYGDRVALRVFERRILLLANPADIHDVLIAQTADFEKSPEVRVLRQVFGDGVYSSQGDLWRKQRRALQPAFDHERILKYGSIVISRMRERTGNWQPGQMLDVFGETSGFTRDVICELIFGTEQSSDTRTIANAVSSIFQDLRAEILYLSFWRKLPLSRSRRWNGALKVLDTAIDSMIAERRLGSQGNDDLLELLFRGEELGGVSEQDVRDEVMTLFLTGVEIPAIALSWAIAVLARHPEVQEEAAAEVADLTKGRPVVAEDYLHLMFVQKVVNEILRLYPPLWTIGRSAIRNTTVRDLAISAGTEVWIPVYHVHRDGRWFTDPDRFDPLRWNDETKRNTLGYFPFGGGQRSCIAQHFAMAEVVLGLAVILSRFRLRSEPGAKMEMDAWLTLRPRKGVAVLLSSQ